ncbi:MAG: helix-turn-helix transcriptional regulator [Clostridia bacterium]|nr:helix-turn-helix transcriptional regulator [Clostridia bacterium]MBQ4575295.1 helix-turn-helix transcriptional regulator [Clostridia bacterium]
MIELVTDSYIWSDKRKVLTKEQMKIDGLEMFGHELRQPESSALSAHMHRSMELVYVVSGNQCYSMEGVNYAVQGNQIFMSSAYVPHSTGEELHGRYEIYWFRLECEGEGSFLNLDAAAGEMLRARLRTLSPPVAAPRKNLKELIAGSFELLGREDVISRMAGCSMLVQFLCEIIGCSDGLEVMSEEMGAVITYIGEHIAESITLDTLAEVSMLSLSRFKARFRQEVKVTPREYINLKKIEAAKRELEQSEHSVTEIAFGLSFSSSDYFSVMFKRIVGCTPSEYRSRKRSENKEKGCCKWNI